MQDKVGNPTGKGGFLPGVSANPGGRPSTRVLTNAILRKLTPAQADAIADNIITILKSNMRIMPQVLHEVFNRIEGPISPLGTGFAGGAQSAVVLLPSNGREAPLQLTASGEVFEAEREWYQLEKDQPADLTSASGDDGAL